MAVLPRKLQLIFASNLAPSGNVAQPGSTVGGSTVYSNDPDVLQDISAGSGSPWVGGLQAQVEGTQAQVLEEMNGVLLTITQQLAYLTERGMSEWLSTQTYYLYAVAYVNGVPYSSLQNNNLNNAPASSPSFWLPLFSAIRSPATLSAQVTFDGTGTINTNCTLLNPSTLLNVASVYKQGTGKYLVTFNNAMSNDGSGNGVYGFTGSAGTQNGAAPVAGDNNIIVGGIPGGANGVRTPTTCVVYCWEANNAGVGVLEDSGMISLSFFG